MCSVDIVISGLNRAFSWQIFHSNTSICIVRCEVTEGNRDFRQIINDFIAMISGSNKTCQQTWLIKMYK